MRTQLPDKKKAVAPSSSMPARSGVLQRKCACGGTPGPDGDCAACRKRRLAAQPLAARPAGHDFGRIGIYPAQAVKVRSAPVNEFEDCPTDWRNKANAALVVGRQWVANVITGLVNLPNPIPGPVAALLNRHFHTTSRAHIAEIIRHYNKINSALNSPIDFECETSCDDNTAAYVYSIWTDVHLCPVWYRQTPRGRANTIIHELAHDAANRDDEAYVWEPAYAKLSAADAIDNADSYSCFAEDAFFGGGGP